MSFPIDTVGSLNVVSVTPITRNNIRQWDYVQKMPFRLTAFLDDDDNLDFDLWTGSGFRVARQVVPYNIRPPFQIVGVFWKLDSIDPYTSSSRVALRDWIYDNIGFWNSRKTNDERAPLTFAQSLTALSNYKLYDTDG